tara:strand:+ start:39 stop:629 length:591 start_codon:yes stop_codon:yes gene_type:complete
MELGGLKHIAEMAHVLPHGEDGPRANETVGEVYDTDSFENLILLCPKCHTIIDKHPEAYPRQTILAWKREHLTSLCLKQGIRSYETRNEVRETLDRRLKENKLIWTKFAPVDGSEFEFNPESEKAELWKLRMKSVILPNHFQIQSLIEVNLHLASKTEQETFAEFKEHVRGLTDRHINGVSGQAIRFPRQMENIFE